MNTGIVSKFNGDEMVMPMLVQMVKIMAEAFDDGLVGPLREALGLRVKGCAEVELSAGQAEERLPEFALKLGAAVRTESIWETKVAEDMLEEQVGYLFAGKGRLAFLEGSCGGSHNDGACFVAGESDESVVAIGGDRQGADNVDAHLAEGQEGVAERRGDNLSRAVVGCPHQDIILQGITRTNRVSCGQVRSLEGQKGPWWRYACWTVSCRRGSRGRSRGDETRHRPRRC
mmetsp:Transcript_29716/g.46554  ORF Transcript_29716/g.46554 Transcript_29716/m.46554 type:complete len:230 (-) Transcript_29716:3464-4153(-)